LAELGALPPLAMVALLLTNDRFLKATFHNAVTGKLSDVALCFLIPLLVSATLGMIVAWTVTRRLWVGAAVTAVVFSALEMSDVAGAIFRRAMAAILGGGPIVLTRDPTDLLALACVPLAVAYGRWHAARRRAAPRRWASAAGALSLIGGSLALMADSPPDRCGEWSAPIAFQVQGDCGTNGLIVVEADSYSGQLTITNGAALLTPLTVSNVGVDRRYNGTSCPYTLEKGEWGITVGNCPDTPGFGPAVDASILEAGDAGSADASADVGAGASAPPVDAGASVARCPATYRTCRAALEGDALWFTCIGADPNVALCRSRLTVLP
jgi:hypothetical protein